MILKLILKKSEAIKVLFLFFIQLKVNVSLFINCTKIRNILSTVGSDLVPWVISSANTEMLYDLYCTEVLCQKLIAGMGFNIFCIGFYSIVGFIILDLCKCALLSGSFNFVRQTCFIF